MTIASYSSIANNTIRKNGSSVFTNADVELGDFLLSAYRHMNVNYPKFHKMDYLSKLGWLATEVLLQDKSMDLYPKEEIGLVLTNANASLDTDIKYFETTATIASPALFVYTLPNIVIGEICIKHKFKGENAFFITEKFDAQFIAQYVQNLFDNNILQACICGWADVLDSQYNTTLFLVEKGDGTDFILFNATTINEIYSSTNG